MSSVPETWRTPRRPHLTPLRAVFAVCGLVTGWITADVAYGLLAASGVLADAQHLRLLTAYLLPWFAGAVLLTLWRFARQGPGPVPRLAFVAGGLFLAVAAGLDLFVTVRSDPHLTLEANPYIRVLLDETEHSLAFIYSHVVLTQTLFVATFVTGWWAFLRHRPEIVRSLHAAAPGPGRPS